MKEKVFFVQEIPSIGEYFFIEPNYDNKDAKDVIKKRWNEKTKTFISELKTAFDSLNNFSASETENIFKQTCEKLGIKTGEVMQLFRVCISGVGGGPALFEMTELLGKEVVINRLERAFKNIPV